MLRPILTFQVIFLLAAATIVLPGCDGCDLASDDSPPWRFAGEQADYEVIFPSNWHAEPPESINENAEVVASHEEGLFFMVIPQPLPSFPEVDVLQFQQEALQTLDNSVDDLVIERQGPVQLDGVSGMSTFATATVDGESIRYITCYVINDDTGYQLVGFAPKPSASKLYEEVDTILAGWQFGSDDPEDEPEQRDVPATGPLEGASDETETVTDD